MNKSRMETFFDGVVAIIITIMVLELKVPEGDTLKTLSPLLPVLSSYVLSFLHLGIYWNNHHHMMQTATVVTGSMLWANLHLLFWLSLVPVTTAWMGENEFARTPTIIYGVVMLLAAVAFYILERRIIASQGEDSVLRKAVGRDWKGKMSPTLYVIAILLAWLSPWLAIAIYLVVVLMWIIPDRRVERILKSTESQGVGGTD